METIIKKCGGCGQKFESRLDNNFCDSCAHDDDNEITDCPNCQRTYDDADRDYLICHHCGYDAEKKNFRSGNRKRSISRFGIDPDVELGDWN